MTEKDPAPEARGRTPTRLGIGESTPIFTLAGVDDAGGSGELRRLRSPVPSVRHLRRAQPSPQKREGTALGSVDERRRLERALHDGVQNELIALIVKLAAAGQDPDAPPALARTLAGLEVLAQSTLDSVRDIARGIYLPVLADFGIGDALRGQAAGATRTTSGSEPSRRSCHAQTRSEPRRTRR